MLFAILPESHHRPSVTYYYVNFSTSSKSTGLLDVALSGRNGEVCETADPERT